jgi:DNA-binding CsgD family transcriptional regulator
MLYTVKETAATLGVNVHLVYNFIRKAHKIIG